MFTPEINLALELIGIGTLTYLLLKLAVSIKNFLSFHFSFKQFLIFTFGHLALLTMLAYGIKTLPDNYSSYGLAFLGLISGYFFADLFTGFYHFMLDNFKFTKVPVLENQAKEFQGHHDDPLDITRQTIGEVFYGPMWGVILYICIVFPLGFHFQLNPLFFWFSVGYPAFASYSQLLHRWTHRDVVAKLNKEGFFLYYLRKFKILINPEHHLKHHNNFHQNYEIVSGLLAKITNPIYKFIHDKILKR